MALGGERIQARIHAISGLPYGELRGWAELQAAKRTLPTCLSRWN